MGILNDCAIAKIELEYRIIVELCYALEMQYIDLLVEHRTPSGLKYL